MDYLGAKILVIIKLVGFPLFFIITFKNYHSYTEWFDTHYSDILSISIGSMIGLSHGMEIHFLTESIWFFTMSLLSLAVKTAVGGFVAFFVNRTLKKYFEKNKKDNEDEKE